MKRGEDVWHGEGSGGGERLNRVRLMDGQQDEVSNKTRCRGVERVGDRGSEIGDWSVWSVTLALVAPASKSCSESPGHLMICSMLAPVRRLFISVAANEQPNCKRQEVEAMQSIVQASVLCHLYFVICSCHLYGASRVSSERRSEATRTHFSLGETVAAAIFLKCASL